MHWSKCGELCILRETTGIRVIDMKSLDFYCHFREIGTVTLPTRFAEGCCSEFVSLEQLAGNNHPI